MAAEIVGDINNNDENNVNEKWKMTWGVKHGWLFKKKKPNLAGPFLFFNVKQSSHDFYNKRKYLRQWAKGVVVKKWSTPLEKNHHTGIFRRKANSKIEPQLFYPYFHKTKLILPMWSSEMQHRRWWWSRQGWRMADQSKQPWWGQLPSELVKRNSSARLWLSNARIMDMSWGNSDLRRSKGLSRGFFFSCTQMYRDMQNWWQANPRHTNSFTCPHPSQDSLWRWTKRWNDNMNQWTNL